MAYYRCAGAGSSGEVHGAQVVVVVEDAAAVGELVTLSYSDTSVFGSKALTESRTVIFEDIQQPDIYVASVTYGGSEYTVEIQVSADDIVNKNLVEALITSRNYLYNNGNEYTDITGGWSIGPKDSGSASKTTQALQATISTSRGGLLIYTNNSVQMQKIKNIYIEYDSPNATNLFLTAHIYNAGTTRYFTVTSHDEKTVAIYNNPSWSSENQLAIDFFGSAVEGSTTIHIYKIWVDWI